jgi:branched-chain amino acid transport system substrate-binding protein
MVIWGYMKKTTIWILLALALIVVTVSIDKSNSSKQVSDQKTIKVGALLALTGDAAAWGENSKKAIQLATDQINKKGGINGKQVEMIYEDTAGDSKKAVSAFQLVTSIGHVTAVLGPLNQNEGVSVMPLVTPSGTPTIIPGYVPLQNRSNLANPLLIWTDAELEAGQMAQYVFDQGIRTVGVVGTLDAWENTVTNAFAEKFKALGGTVTDEEIVQPTTSEMKLPITKIVASKPQAVYMGTYYQFVNSTKELKNLGYKGKLYGIEVDDYLASQTSGWAQGLQFIAPDFYVGDFVKTFTDTYGIKPGLPAGQSYDAANILFSFLTKSEKQSDILDMMKGFTAYKGVSGQLEVLPDGRTQLPTAIFEMGPNATIQRVVGVK